MHGRAFLDEIFQRRHEMSMDVALASLLDNQGNAFKNNKISVPCLVQRLLL
jgi:hypothetical protein